VPSGYWPGSFVIAIFCRINDLVGNVEVKEVKPNPPDDVKISMRATDGGCDSREKCLQLRAQNRSYFGRQRAYRRDNRRQNVILREEMERKQGFGYALYNGGKAHNSKDGVDISLSV
jgi:hypothetical protein